jgi:predicted Zn-dependent protease
VTALASGLIPWLALGVTLELASGSAARPFGAAWGRGEAPSYGPSRPVAGREAQSTGDKTSRRAAAQQAMAERRFDEAAGLYRELLNSAPDDPATLTALGAALLQGRHPDQAVAPLEHAIQVNADSLAAHALLGSAYLALGQYEKSARSLERVVAARPTDVDHRRMLAEVYRQVNRPVDAVKLLREATSLAPKQPSGWYELGQAYNAVAEQAMATLGSQPEDSPWRQLLVADALVARGPLTDAFFLYRQILERLPSMVSIHDSIARIYERTGHPDWAVRERELARAAPTICVKRRALCEFLAGRHGSALNAALAEADVESQYWRIRAGSELALAAFAKLDALPDGLERRAIRATRARAEERYTDAVTELKAALKFAPGMPTLVFDLASAFYEARDYEQALATLSPLLEANPNDGRLLTLAGNALLQLRRPAEATPMLQRAARDYPTDPTIISALGRAHLQNGDLAAAVPLLEAQLESDLDGSVHVQLARAYSGLGRREESAALLLKSQELQRAAEERRKLAEQRAITPPK